mmetsp:Transcript_10899/g.44604  ORF Transcript_10899/g.44604 Transcript_10899/m.44604 type:complete len:252 (-) Transcript_10899:1387-2142(-)
MDGVVEKTARNGVNDIHSNVLLFVLPITAEIVTRKSGDGDHVAVDVLRHWGAIREYANGRERRFLPHSPLAHHHFSWGECRLPEGEQRECGGALQVLLHCVAPHCAACLVHAVHEHRRALQRHRRTRRRRIGVHRCLLAVVGNENESAAVGVAEGQEGKDRYTVDLHRCTLENRARDGVDTGDLITAGDEVLEQEGTLRSDSPRGRAGDEKVADRVVGKGFLPENGMLTVSRKAVDSAHGGAHDENLSLCN